MEGVKKSVLDYMIIETENEDLVKEMWIDSDREYTPKHLVDERYIYTDHNTMMLEMNWNMRYREKENKRTCINSKRKNQFNEKTSKGELLAMWKDEKETLIKFSQWNEKVMEIAEETFKEKIKKKRERKEIRILKRKKKELEKRMVKVEKEEKEMLQKRRKLIDMHIEEYRRQDNAYKTQCVAKKIKSEKGFDGGAFWEYLKKVEGRRSEAVKALRNEEGVLEEDPEAMIEIYQNFYQKLLTGKAMKTKEGVEVEQLVNKYVEVLERKALREVIEPFTKEEYQEVKKEIKNGKALTCKDGDMN